jgi:hypothetical protein
MRLKEKEVEVGNLYLTTANQYRAVLAMKGEFLIYAPSLEGTASLNLDSTKMPFENMPFKKCQISTFAKKDYQVFDFNGHGKFVLPDKPFARKSLLVNSGHLFAVAV